MLKSAIPSGKSKYTQRLAKLPTLDEINGMKVEAFQCRGRIEELVWVHPSDALEYNLMVTCKPNCHAPVWTLSKGEHELLWKHQSNDVILIFNMIIESCSDRESKAQADSVLYGCETGSTVCSSIARSDAADVCSSITRSDAADITHSTSEPILEFRAEVSRISKHMINPITGIFTTGALMYFLEYEFRRCRRARQNLSLVLFKVNFEHTLIQRAVAESQIADEIIVRSFEQVKRDIDLIGHFESGTYALLMPQTSSTGACTAIKRLLKELTRVGFGPDQRTGVNPVHMAVVSAPEGATDLPSLILAAKAALQQAEVLSNPM